jgi:two-component system sensor histidine kinase/response regulator
MPDSLAFVIDDSRATADALSNMLTLLGITAQSLYGPRTGFYFLKEALESSPAPVGLILLDLHMPGIDGFGMLAFFQRDPRLVKIPVVVVTSDDQPETAQRALQAGARQVLVKPVVFETLEKTLRELDLI